VNPNCPPGSLRGTPAPYSALGGGPARNGQHVFQVSVAEHEPMPARQYVVDGRVVGTVAGRGSVLAALRDGRMLVFGLPNWPEPPNAPRAFPLPARVLDVPDALATAGDRVHVLTEDGAWALDAPERDAPRRHVAGKFAAQVVSPGGWLLVEAAPEGARLHRLSPDGANALPPVAAPTALADARWLLPAADAQHVYWADARGQAWRMPWDGGEPQPFGPATGAPSSVILGEGTAFVLPIMKDGQAAMVRADGGVATFAMEDRPALAAALSSGARQRRLWTGAAGPERVRAVDLDLVTQSRSISGLRDEPRQLAVIRRPDGLADVVAVLADQGVYVRSWRDEPPFDAVLAVHGSGPGGAEAAPRLVLADPWACFACNVSGQAVFTLSILT
jgi:hypothetical protein